MSLVNIKDIRPNPYQVRQSMDPERLKQLAAEIKETGLWKGAIRARQIDGHYELVFGHRRLEALKLLGEKRIDIEIVQLDDSQMATQALVENLQREGLTDFEKAEGIKRLFGVLGSSQNVKKLANMLGYSEATIYDFQRMAELDAKTKAAAQEAHLGRGVIRRAEQIGGAEFVRVAAAKKLKMDELLALQTELAKLPEAAKRTVREGLKSGKLKPKAEAVEVFELRHLRRRGRKS